MASRAIRMKPTMYFFLFFLMMSLILFYYYYPYQSSKRNVATVNTKRLLAAGLDLLGEAGKRIVEIRRSPYMNAFHKIVGKEKEAATELLTTADITSHNIITLGLKTTFPGLQVLSEEHAKSADDFIYMPNLDRMKLPQLDDGEEVPVSEMFVWIDPLDATQEYTENLTSFVTNMMCVVRNGEPIIGIIHKVFERKTYWAYKSSSMTQVSWGTKDGLSPRRGKPKLMVSRSHAGDVQESVQRKFGNMFVVLPAGGSGFKTIEVIEGRADAYLHKTAIKKWDICAPDALLRISGARLTDLNNKLIDYSDPNDFVSTGGLLVSRGDIVDTLNHSQFLERMKDRE